MPPSAQPSRSSARRARAVAGFARARFGPRGTLALHRRALGGDLLRAPANVALAPVFLLVRLLALLAALIRARRLARWLASRRILFETRVAAQVARDVHAFLDRLDAEGIGPVGPRDARLRAVADYATVRNAVAEITTSLLVMLTGLAVFKAATPGVLSMAAPLAGLRAQAAAIETFPLGSWLGGAWYGIFPVSAGPAEIAATALVLMMLASVVTTFAGLIADPVQLWTGLHARRLRRLLVRLDATEAAGPALAGEHVTARLGDLGDVAVGLWRALRG